MRQLVETMKDNLLYLGALHSITDGDIAYELELIENLTSDCDELMAMKTSLKMKMQKHSPSKFINLRVEFFTSLANQCLLS